MAREFNVRRVARDSNTEARGAVSRYIDCMTRVLAAPRTQPCVEPLTGLTPWEVCQRLADRQHLLFLDSAQESALGRYSYVCADPVHVLKARRDRVDPLARLAARLAEFPLESIAGLPPFQGGAAGMFGYDLCHQFERLPSPRFEDFAIPDLMVGIYDWVIAFDHYDQTAWLISTGYPEAEPDRRQLRARRRIDQVKRWLDRRTVRRPTWSRKPIPIASPQFPVEGRAGLTSNFNRDDYLATIERAIEYIRAGDCFQVNIAQRLMTPAPPDPLALYEKLRARNPAPFAAYFDLGGRMIASASPERFLRVQAGNVETRPIKGTRPRGSTPEEDRRLVQELRASAKDRAENVMIVDLLRNDLGRVCEYGSVRVESLCQLESHPFVHHLVSEVRGRLRPGLGPTDLLRAAFPGGSVTGAPKIRAMEIIAELERTARGPYCGCLGWLGFNGDMDTNLLIRTFIYGDGWLHFSVGGGIVADSSPEREYAETWHKAEGLLRALRD
jgi:para-aminobenzoate synthetase component 1